MMKTYHGTPNPHGAGAGRVSVASELYGGKHKPLRKRLDLANHSPDGFAWGYGGSGPAQLALAILADHLGDDERAVQLYQRFKWNKIARIDGDSDWAMNSEQIDQWLAEIDGETDGH